MIKQDFSTKQQAPYSFYHWLYKFLSGAVIGLANATFVTPLVNYNNHVINQSATVGEKTVKFTCARAFDGVMSYNLSFVLRISVALTLNSFFMHQLERHYDVNHAYNLLSSIVAGGLAGSSATLAEAVAQTQQLSLVKPAPMEIIREAYKNNGLFGLSRGMQAMMVRSAFFTSGYLGLMPLICQRVRQEIGDHVVADIFSAMVCGLIVGPITTPPNALRFGMQKDFTKKGPAPTYTQLIKEAYTSKEGLRHLFAGVKPRTVMSMVSMFVIAEGNKLCDLYSTDGFPEFSTLGFKKG